MKKLFTHSNLLLLLLIGYVGYCFYRVPSLADGLIIGSLSLLLGLSKYLDSKKPIDPTEDLLKRIQECENKVSTISLGNTRLYDGRAKEQFKW